MKQIEFVSARWAAAAASEASTRGKHAASAACLAPACSIRCCRRRSAFAHQPCAGAAQDCCLICCCRCTPAFSRQPCASAPAPASRARSSRAAAFLLLACLICYCCCTPAFAHQPRPHCASPRLPRLIPLRHRVLHRERHERRAGLQLHPAPFHGPRSGRRRGDSRPTRKGPRGIRL